MTERRVVILRPAPQTVERIFTAQAWAELQERYEVRLLDEADPDVESEFDALLPEAFAVIGQAALPAERLERAGQLRALVNVEGNFFPNVDYASCFARGVQVLGCGPAYAVAVAEYALGLALDLARGISREDRAFRAGREALRLGLDAGLDPAHRRRGGAGRLRQPRPGPAPAARTVPAARSGSSTRGSRNGRLTEAGAIPADLDELLPQSTFVFVLATVTAESEHLLDEAGSSRSDRARGSFWSAERPSSTTAPCWRR